MQDLLITGQFCLTNAAFCHIVDNPRAMQSGNYSMHLTRHHTTACLLILLCCTCGTYKTAAGTLRTFGPVPIQTSAVTPLEEVIGHAVVLDEDFNDGFVNSLGLYQPLSQPTHGVIVDGAVPSNKVLRSNFFAFRPTSPRVTTSFLRFAFNEEELAGLPRAVGLTWAQGPADSIVRVKAFDASQNVISEDVFGGPSSPWSQSHSSFFGAIYDEGVMLVEIAATYTGNTQVVAVDNFQYGLIVPEPAQATLVLVTLVFAPFHRSRQTK